MVKAAYEELLETRVVFGSPESVIDRLTQFQEMLGITGITAELNPGGFLAKEAVHRSLRLLTANCIGAGGIESEEADGGLSFPPGPRDPVNRWGKPEEIAFLAVSLASEEAGYVTGQCVMANGGKYFL